VGEAVEAAATLEAEELEAGVAGEVPEDIMMKTTQTMVNNKGLST
jgi:hypothetical protein